MRQLLVPFLFAVLCPAWAQAQSSSDALMQTLISEVRQLRLALERSTIVVPKIQMTLQRVQLQQDAVSRASRDLDAARNQLTRSADEQMHLSVEMKRAEAVVAQEQDPLRRKDFEGRVAALKTSLDQMAATQAEQRVREGDLGVRLNYERAKLEELNDRLNTLERSLDSPQPKQP
ncbi:MAG: hypothetical protein JST93_26395 [Acidobacteria bacterium]|nr:hypothetical protein [Acidobacteriota bacterium]